MRSFIVLISMLFLSGCIPYSDYPLTPTNKDQIDQSIFGTWYWKKRAKSGYFHIGLDKETKLLRFTIIEMKDSGRLKSTEFIGHTSSFKGNNYLNLKWKTPENDSSTGYILLKYSIDSDRLGIRAMNPKVVQKAIEAGVLKGKVGKDKWITSISIKENQKKLQKFILENDKTLFAEVVHLPKLKLPEYKTE